MNEYWKASPHKGRPLDIERFGMLKAKKKLEAKGWGELERNPIPLEKIGAWGGKRKGAGRPKKVGGKAKQRLAAAEVKGELADRLERLPGRVRSKYIRKALELLVELQAPEEFK